MMRIMRLHHLDELLDEKKGTGKREERAVRNAHVERAAENTSQRQMRASDLRVGVQDQGGQDGSFTCLRWQTI